MQNSDIDRAKEIIQNNRYLSLATTLEGEPWVAVLYYAIDKYYNFFFLSAKTSCHALHIQQNPKVAFTIYNSQELPENADGVQVAGLAHMLTGTADILHAIDIYYLRRFPDEKIRAEHLHSPQDFRDNTLRRFFRITPTHLYALDTNSTKIDRRIEVSLEG